MYFNVLSLKSFLFANICLFTVPLSKPVKPINGSCAGVHLCVPIKFNDTRLNYL